MNQKSIHLVSLFLKPALGTELIAVFTEYVRITVNDPRIDTKDGLELGVSNEYC